MRGSLSHLRLWPARATAALSEFLAAFPQQGALAQLLIPGEGGSTSHLIVDQKGSYDAQYGSASGADTNDPTLDVGDHSDTFTLDDSQICAVAPSIASMTVSFAFAFNRGGDESGMSIYVHDNASDFGMLHVFFGSGADANKVAMLTIFIGSTMTANALPLGWHSVVITIAPGDVDIYIDGALAGSSGNGLHGNAVNGPYRSWFSMNEFNQLTTALISSKRGAFAFWEGAKLDAAEVAAAHAALRAIHPTIPA